MMLELYTGYKGNKNQVINILQLVLLICMVMAIYSGHEMLSGKKKTQEKELVNAENEEYKSTLTKHAKMCVKNG